MITLKDSFINIGIGVTANVIFTGLIIAFGWVIYYFTERRKLLLFFNITDTKRLVIYLSNLRILNGGSIGTDGKRRNYSGSTVVYNEQIAANKFKEIFNYLMPSLSESPSFLSKILFADIKVANLPSPLTNFEIESNCTIISIGSPGYNIVSEEIENYKESQVRMAKGNTEIDIDNVPNFTSGEDGFIQRIIRNTDGTRKCSFYVAGLSERGTFGAANYLSQNWKILRKKFKDDQSFIILLKFPTSNIDQYTIILDRKLE
jgi:hypothetical protein